jgi:hypothetical protein
MDTMIMAVRVALLILTTGTFAALWSGDHPDQLVGANQPIHRLDNQRNLLPKQRIQAPEIDRGQQPGYEIPQSASNEFSHAPQLPEDISSGTYLVADRFGRTTIQTVLPEHATRNGKANSTAIKNHYSVEVGKARWHFIRLDDHNIDQTAVLPSSIQ